MILGGAKIDTKLSLITHFAGIADYILIGGGMAFTFLKAQGKEIGNSLIDPSMLSTAKAIMSKARGKSKLILPTDFVCAETMDDSLKAKIHNVGDIPPQLMGLDIGPETINKYSEIILNSKTILWNGPMGVFEVDGFHYGTQKIAERLADVTVNDTITIIGGGDSAAAINKYRLMDKVSHVSTGGGASLELLSGNSLPAIYSLEL